MIFGDVVDQLLDQDGFTDTRTGEEAGLATLGEWGNQVNDLDTCLEDFGSI